MEASAKQFSSSPKRLRARDAVLRADRKWKQRAAGLSVLAVAAVALISVGSAQLINRTTQTPPPVIAKQPSPTPVLKRQAREVLEPRPEVWPSRLRKVPLRGRDVEFGQGALEAASGDGASRPFTLVHTKVDIAITGFMQGVTVTQVFQNPFSSPVEAVYVFPLPDDSAVHAMELHAGARIIKAEIQKREVARSLYEVAKQEGRRAALLDQERPNVFTQSIANLLPGEMVEVTLQYVAPLAYDDGVYTLNFPMVVGPRYIPGAALPGESEGRGTARDTDQVVDASRITPPTVRNGRDIEVHVRLDAGTVIEDLWSVSHRLEVERFASSRLQLDLNPYDTLPNKDLIVRWRISGQQARASMLAGGGAFALMLNPESSSANLPPTPKEMVFVIDTSCSMNGAPLAAAKLAMQRALTQMNPDDTFMLIDFADKASRFHGSPLLATPDAVQRAVSYLKSLPSGGGTNQLAGIRAALGRAEDPDRVRMVLFMTDGFIGNEEEILSETQRLRGGARVFGFGIGSSVNHYLLSRLSTEGRGFYQYVRPDEDSGPAVERFVKRVRRPLITDVTVEWGGLPVADVMPEPIADLFDAQPLIIQGRYRAAASGTVLLKGKRAGKPVVFEVPVTLPELTSEGRALTMAWARRRIEALSAEYDRVKPEAAKEMAALGLEYHLVTKYTSLVATEKTPVTDVPVTTVTEPTLAADQTATGDTSGLLGALKDTGSSQGFGGLGLRGTGVGGGGIGTAVGVGHGAGTKGLMGGAANGTLGGRGGGRFGNPLLVKADPAPGDDFDKAFGGKREEPAEPATKLPDPGSGGDDFDNAFGANSGKPMGGELKRSPVVTGSLLPAPGGASLVKASLEQGDVMEGVLAKKAQLAVCAAMKEPGTSGKLVMKWSIRLDGTTWNIAVDSGSEDLKGTRMAACFANVIRSMRFPRHSVLGDPVKFPFKY
jgi:Ca-activated chloride channel family protein